MELRVDMAEELKYITHESKQEVNTSTFTLSAELFRLRLSVIIWGDGIYWSGAADT